MNVITRLLLVTLLVIFCNLDVWSLTTKEIVQKNRGSVVTIISLEGSGSGVVIGESGYIITNQHVVDGGSHVIVMFGDSESLVGEVVYEDAGFDLAIVKVDSALIPVEIGGSEFLEAGDRVVSISSPFGYMETISEGVVCGLRRIPIHDYFVYFTSLHAYPGSSGGSVFNDDGKLVGVIFAVDGRTGGGISFVVPVLHIRLVVAEMRLKMAWRFLESVRLSDYIGMDR